MSLINDALKKAQQLQTQGQAHSMGSTGSPKASSGQAPPPPNPGGTPGAPSLPASSGRERSMPGQIFMLLAFGAGALIALSVLATVYLLRQPAAPAVAQAPTAVSPTGTAAPALSLSNGSNPSNGPIAPEKPEPAPVIETPALALPQTIPPPTPGETIATAPAPVVAKLPTPPPTIAPAPGTAPVVAATPVASPAPSQPALPVLRSPEPVERGEGGSLPNGSNPLNGLDPSKPDPKILAYLDALQVAGIRVSDTGSKVLMNDRVYRESEIVDHLLGLRLKKVESDTLTFVDERGVTYTKNF